MCKKSSKFAEVQLRSTSACCPPSHSVAPLSSIPTTLLKHTLLLTSFSCVFQDQLASTGPGYMHRSQTESYHLFSSLYFTAIFPAPEQVCISFSEQSLSIGVPQDHLQLFDLNFKAKLCLSKMPLLRGGISYFVKT